MRAEAAAPMIGEILGHYRIVAKIGAGGMGEVYRAHDEQLDRHVALKVLPKGALANESARKQFRKEALALAKLNHPNVETVHEFGSQDGFDYLVMELIPGTSLKERLSQGPLPQSEVLRLGIQLADALAAAHVQGVVHRDLKPGNLMITPEGRLKILDFGLAKFVRSEVSSEVTRTITEDHGTVSGTLPYMSPEQLGALPVDGRSDIYSAGVVLYEMATGTRPFRDEQSARLIAAILHQTPPPPRSLNNRISPGLERVVSKALEKEPSQRFQSAGELRAALEGISMAGADLGVGARQGVKAPPLRTPRGIALAAGLCVLLLLSMVFGWNVGGVRDRIFHRKPPASQPPVGKQIKPRRSVAVLGFKNVSGRPDEDWRSTALSEMLTTELAAGEELRTVPGEDVAHMKINLSLPEADSYGQQTLEKIRENLDADDVVLGSFVPLGHGEIRLDLRLQDAVNGGILDAVSEKGSETQMDELVSRAGVELRAKLGVSSVSAAEASALKATVSSNPEAEKLYSEGLSSLRSFDNLKARDLLERTVAIDPDFTLAHSALASAWKGLGYDEKAREEAKKAFDLSSGLEREDRLRVEGQYREMTNDWEKAGQIYRSLYEFFPDNLEYGLLLAGAETHAGKGRDALATADSLRRLSPPSGEDPRIDLMAADAANSLGDFKEVLSYAQTAADKARAKGANLLLARALYLISSANESLGNVKESAAASEESAALYSAARDRNGIASTLEARANVLSDQGNLPGAIADYEQELAIAREVGNMRAEASALNNKALLLDQQDDLAGADDMYEQALTAFQQIGDKKNSAMTQLNIGGILLQEGDLAGAKKEYEQALATSREVNDNNGVGLAMESLGTVFDAEGNLASAKKQLDQAIAGDLQGGRRSASYIKLVDLGDVLQHLGNLEEAEKNYNEALQLANQSSDKSAVASAYYGLGALAIQRAQEPEAQRNFEQALAIQNQIEDNYGAEVTKIAMDKLAIETGNAQKAASHLQTVLESLHKAGRTADELTVRAMLIRAALAQGKIDEAKREMETAAALAPKTEKMASRFDFAIAEGLVRISLHEFSSARSILEKVRLDATKAGYVEYEFEARLALAELAIQSGQTAQGAAELKEIREDAAGKGFVQMAQKAEALMK
jgi:eukaryotic-like serine/threonine-protein kinase